VPASAAAKPQAWGDRIRRTPLVAGGFVVGALIGALPPLRMAAASWQCEWSGGRYDAELRACAYRADRPVQPREVELLREER
jgi:hypothetical protein